MTTERELASPRNEPPNWSPNTKGSVLKLYSQDENRLGRQYSYVCAYIFMWLRQLKKEVISVSGRKQKQTQEGLGEKSDVIIF